jgi:eukaryotic-like serine/threonine-protein kinase
VRTPTWILLLAVAVFVALFGWWGDTRLQRTLEQGLRTELETTLRANTIALEIWMTNQARLAAAFAAEPGLRAAALERLSAPPPERGDARGPETWRQGEELTRLLQTRLGVAGYEGLVISTNQRVIAAPERGRGRLGFPVPEEHQAKLAELFSSGQPVMITPFRPAPPGGFPGGFRGPGGPGGTGWPFDRPGSLPDRPPFRWAERAPENNRLLMQVAAPIRDDDGVIRGALALIIDPETEFSRILSVARFGETGETYAFDQTGLMVSRSRFDVSLKELGLLEDRPEVTSALTLQLLDPGGDLTRGHDPELALTNRPLTRLVADAVAGTAGVAVKPTRDYRGVPVVGAWQWLPQHGFGVVTQRDAREAFRALRVLRGLFVILFLLLVLTANALLLASYLGVVWRRRLTEAELKARRLGQYQLEEKIGEGGMGVVYRGRHALLRRDTAIKLLLPDRADHDAVRRFEQEVRLTCQLTHPNTIQVYDYGHTPEGLFYYAMEFLQGLNLRDLVVQFGPQPEARVIQILIQVCDSLHEAHQQGLIHRDIKPANVFLTRRGGVPDSVKVLDFGLVQRYRGGAALKEGDPRDLAVVGTPLFMSPESSLDTTTSDPRSDIYSLGALAYYLLTGQHVFEGRTSEELREQHLRAIPLPVRHRTINPVSPELEQAVLACLEKDRERRPQSVRALRGLLLACPTASAWTLEAREDWWRRHGPTLSPRSAGDTHETRLDIDRTVRIDPAGREG